MKNRRTMILFTLIIATMLFAFVTFKPQAQDKTQQQDEEATVVQRGQVTDEERSYSREYEKLYPNRRKIKLNEVRKEIKDLGIFLGVVGDVIDIPEAPIITAADFLKNLSCEADAVVVGYPVSKKAHLSEDETFVYTQYEFSVEEVIKDNLTSPITVNNSIQITRPGGVIKLDNRKITVKDELYEPLQIRKKYLLFLNFVPVANGYMVTGSEGDFLLENNSFKKLSKGMAPDELKKGDNPNLLLSSIRDSVASDCKPTTKGGN